MENSFKIKVVNLLTFFVVVLFLNYIFGKVFDSQVIVTTLQSLPQFIGEDILLKKLIVLLFYGVYVFVYIFSVTYLLQRIFNIHKTYIYTHLNALIIGLFIVGAIWLNYSSSTYTPSWYIIALPLISVVTLGLHGLLIGNIELFDSENNSGGLFSSMRGDVSGANKGIGNFFSKLKEDFNTEKTDDRFGGIGNGENEFGNENNNYPFGINNDDIDNDMAGFPIRGGNEDNDDFIDLADMKEPLPDVPEKISARDIKSILKSNRESIQQDTGMMPIDIDNMGNGSMGELNEDGTINMDDGITGGINENSEDGFIDVGQFDDDRGSSYIDNDMGIVPIIDNGTEDNKAKETQEFDLSKYYIVGYDLDRDEQAIKELLKVL